MNWMDILNKLETGELRSANKVNGKWVANTEVKQGILEAFKAGEITSYREANPVKWDQNYDFPAVTAGDVVKSVIPRSRPSGIEGFVFNTRKPMFADWRVREALINAFNFELVNQTISGGVNPRIVSYFSNSELSGNAAEPASAAGRPCSLAQSSLKPATFM